jgi:putative intracellular protease/amidase
MNHTVHAYVFDGYVDSELAYAVGGINHPRYHREPGRWRVRTVGAQSRVPVRSMGGFAVLPDLAIDALDPGDSAMLLLPGGPGWEEHDADSGPHAAAIDLAGSFLRAGRPVAAICGATAGLAKAGLLDERPHTSNAKAYLAGTHYRGGELYREVAAVRERGLITAGGTKPVDFAREVFAELRLYDDDVLEAWFELYRTGETRWFMRLQKLAQARALKRQSEAHA